MFDDQHSAENSEQESLGKTSFSLGNLDNSVSSRDCGKLRFSSQGILRDRFLSSGLLGQFVNPLEAFTKIFLFNLFMGGLVYATICNFFEVDEVPLGYFAIWFSISIFGIIEGTNSFVYPYENIYASLRGFLRTGFWEFADTY